MPEPPTWLPAENPHRTPSEGRGWRLQKPGQARLAQRFLRTRQANERRARILQCLAVPLTLRELGRRCGLATGTLVHHVGVLKRTGRVDLARIPPYVVVHTVPSNQRPEVALLTAAEWALLRTLTAKGRTSQRDLLDASQAPRSTTQHRLNRLERLGFCRSQWQGRLRMFEAIP